MNEFLKKYDPAVPKSWLVILGGGTWSIVGLALCFLAAHWLAATELMRRLILIFSGTVLAIVMYYFIFSRIAKKNIDRLDVKADKICLFAFQAWRSYLIIVFMAFLGYFLRHSDFPKDILSVIYITIGGALTFASFHYYRYLRLGHRSW